MELRASFSLCPSVGGHPDIHLRSWRLACLFRARRDPVIPSHDELNELVEISESTDRAFRPINESLIATHGMCTCTMCSVRVPSAA
jgi:hypothetical protein